jgi:hypothetical protein
MTTALEICGSFLAGVALGCFVWGFVLNSTDSISFPWW